MRARACTQCCKVTNMDAPRCTHATKLEMYHAHTRLSDSIVKGAEDWVLFGIPLADLYWANCATIPSVALTREDRDAILAVVKTWHAAMATDENLNPDHYKVHIMTRCSYFDTLGSYYDTLQFRLEYVGPIGDLPKIESARAKESTKKRTTETRIGEAVESLRADGDKLSADIHLVCSDFNAYDLRAEHKWSNSLETHKLAELANEYAAATGGMPNGKRLCVNPHFHGNPSTDDKDHWIPHYQLVYK